jgi:hypothetical protein
LDEDLIKFAKEHLVITHEYHVAAEKGESSWANVRDVFDLKTDVNERNIKAVRHIISRAEKTAQTSSEALKELRLRTVTLVA